MAQLTDASPAQTTGPLTMHPRRNILKTSSDWFHTLLTLLTLVTFAATGAIYEMLARNQLFLAFRLESNLQLFEIISVFNWLPVLGGFLPWITLRRIYGPLAQGFLLVIYFGLFLVLFFQVHNTYLPDGWQSLQNSYLFWIVPAGLLSLASFRFPNAFRTFILVLSPIVLLFPALFLFRTWTVPPELFPSEKTRAQPVAAFTDTAKQFSSIFLVVFDELNLDILLDASGRIDGNRFPHFRELADRSHWFRNATANADHTYQSIPTLLTGNFPVARPPFHNFYPDNLFNLLAPYYEIYAYESWTRFCVPRRFHCLSATDQGSPTHLDLVRDISYLFAARIVPRGVDLPLPDARQNWGLFRDPKTVITGRLERFDHFMDTVASFANKETVFCYFHHGLPHSPYVLAADGRILETAPGEREFLPTTSVASRLNPDVLARYRGQVMYVDKQLGDFLARLRETDLYERSLLIVTSDHGVSYHPRAPGRSLSEIEGRVLNANLILSIPLFIKLPLQQEGVVSDRDVQLIDLVPTVAGLFELKVPWTHVGRSAFEPQHQARAKIAYSQSGIRYELPANLGLARESFELDSSHDRPATVLEQRPN